MKCDLRQPFPARLVIDEGGEGSFGGHGDALAGSHLFLAALSGSVVALALVGQSTSYGSAFVGFALIILPVVLFIGLVTLVRLGQVNSLDLLYIQAMNRIRHAYLELVPGVAPYLSTATHDYLTSLYSTFAIRLRPNPRLQLLTTTPAVVSVICSVVGGVIAGIVANQIWSGIAPPIVAGAVGFLAMMVILQAYNQRAFQGFARSLEARFPQPSGGADRTTTPVP